MNTLLPVTRMLDAALNGTLDLWNPEETSVWHSPRADVLEGDKEYRIVIDMPGVEHKDLDISLENQTLTVKAERRHEVPEGFQLRRHERPCPMSFSRSFSLGTGVDAGSIQARFEQGVLTITLPKSERALPRRIEVR